MNNKLFDHLVLSLKEAGAIKRDEIQASQAKPQTLGCLTLKQGVKKWD